ncbi:hypothetical protein BGW80DRAFT_1392387 [Lactifluus volemus]|nr:hypothetical protein BGW80DRAFT_1392387 [Lactifluus volemus]
MLALDAQWNASGRAKSARSDVASAWGQPSVLVVSGGCDKDCARVGLGNQTYLNRALSQSAAESTNCGERLLP